MDPTPVPREIGRANQHDIRIVWNDGSERVYPARHLRLQCPCAMCVDELTGIRTLDPKRVPEGVKPDSVELVGRYALRIFWSDRHSSGIYTFKLLKGLPRDSSSRGALEQASQPS